jgi:hypothetical protein
VWDYFITYYIENSNRFLFHIIKEVRL